MNGSLLSKVSNVTTPGTKSSEFLVTVLIIVADVSLAWAGTIGDGTAAKYGVIGSVAYVISRGLAKYETRPVGTAPSAPAPVPPAATTTPTATP